MPYFESPNRVRKIKQSLEQNSTFQILPAEDDSDWPNLREHILAVHRHDYLEYIETIYDEWVAVGGDKVEHLLHRHLASGSSLDRRLQCFPKRSDTASSRTSPI